MMTNDEKIMQWLRPGAIVPVDMDTTRILIEALRARLAQPEPKLVEHDFQKALLRAYHLGQRYWADADSESYSANKRADKHRQDFDALCEEAISYTAPPQRKWVGLTDEEVDELYSDTAVPISMAEHAKLIRAIEAKLKEKNNG